MEGEDEDRLDDDKELVVETDLVRATVVVRVAGAGVSSSLIRSRRARSMFFRFDIMSVDSVWVVSGLAVGLVRGRRFLFPSLSKENKLPGRALVGLMAGDGRLGGLVAGWGVESVKRGALGIMEDKDDMDGAGGTDETEEEDGEEKEKEDETGERVSICVSC
jgi:hypothetical protein